MKKLILTSILMFLVNVCISQIKPGRYIIKLNENNKAFYAENGDGIALYETTNASLNSQNFLWDVKAVRNQPGLFLIQKVSNLKCLTFKFNTSLNRVYESTFMEAQKPLATISTQSFRIALVGNGNYTIQPGNIKDNDDYLAANMGTINTDGTLEFENKTQAVNSSTYRNTANIYFKFINAPSGTSNVVVTQVLQPIQSPSVFVTPKSDNKLDIDFKTGSDNLDPKEFMEGLKVTLKINNKPDIVKENVNEGKEWPNNSVRRVSIELPADVVCEDISQIILSRMPKSRTWNNVTGIIGDNWNLDKVTVTTRIKINGQMKTRTMNWMSPSGSSFPLFRFVYENRSGEQNAGSFLTLNTSGTICPIEAFTPTSTTSTAANAVLTCVFGTGGDDLEGGNGNNVNIRIKFKSSNTVVFLNNINDTAKWNNFTENTVTKSIPNSTNIDINDIKEVEIRHTGGGGMAADNWHVDKIFIRIAKNGQSKILVDQVGAPIHMFTGERRTKSFNVD